MSLKGHFSLNSDSFYLSLSIPLSCKLTRFLRVNKHWNDVFRMLSTRPTLNLLISELRGTPSTPGYTHYYHKIHLLRTGPNVTFLLRTRSLPLLFPAPFPGLCLSCFWVGVCSTTRMSQPLSMRFGLKSSMDTVISYVS